MTVAVGHAALRISGREIGDTIFTGRPPTVSIEAKCGHCGDAELSLGPKSECRDQTHNAKEVFHGGKCSGFRSHLAHVRGVGQDAFLHDSARELFALDQELTTDLSSTMPLFRKRNSW